MIDKNKITEFHKDPNFNFQMNRWMVLGKIPEAVMKKAALQIKNLQDWRRVFTTLGLEAIKKGDIQRAAAYYRAVDFFLPYSDSHRTEHYDKVVHLLRQHYQTYFNSSRIQEQKVSYDGIDLPLWFIPANKKNKCEETILMSGGFDAYKEELVDIYIGLADKGFDVYYFEGPGQGEVLFKNNYPMTYKWEEPVKAILDFLGKEEITLMGLSLGGYLSPRAASQDQRVKRLICWGVVWDFFDVVTSRRGPGLQRLIKTLLKLRLKGLLNILLKIGMKKDPYMHWGIDHGMKVMGCQTPAHFMSAIKEFTLSPIVKEIHQDVLLMHGNEDHFIPMEQFIQLKQNLTETKSLTTKVFTRDENAQNHCMFGNIDLVIQTIANWMNTPTF